MYLVPNGPKFRQRCASGKKRREGERKETGKYTSVVDLARARVNQQHTENSTGKISPVIADAIIANTSRHGKHWMTNWPTLSGLVMWMPETLTAASIAGQKMKLSTTTEKLEAYLGINAQTA